MRSPRDTIRQPFLAAILALALGCAAPDAGSDSAMAEAEPTAAEVAEMPPSPMADPADVESIDAIITAVYEAISGDAGVERDWDRFRTLFLPQARLMPVASQHGQNGPQQFGRLDHAGRIRDQRKRLVRRRGLLRDRDRKRHRAVRRHRPPLQQLRVILHRGSRRGAVQPRHQLVPAALRRGAVVGAEHLLAARTRRRPDSGGVSERAVVGRQPSGPIARGVSTAPRSAASPPPSPPAPAGSRAAAGCTPNTA